MKDPFSGTREGDKGCELTIKVSKGIKNFILHVGASFGVNLDAMCSSAPCKRVAARLDADLAAGLSGAPGRSSFQAAFEHTLTL
jgi:hypothetical protein